MSVRFLVRLLGALWLVTLVVSAVFAFMSGATQAWILQKAEP